MIHTPSHHHWSPLLLTQRFVIDLDLVVLFAVGSAVDLDYSAVAVLYSYELTVVVALNWLLIEVRLPGIFDSLISYVMYHSVHLLFLLTFSSNFLKMSKRSSLCFGSIAASSSSRCFVT